jgi:hypothetical protein
MTVVGEAVRPASAAPAALERRLLAYCGELGLVPETIEDRDGQLVAAAVFDVARIYRHVLVRRWGAGPVGVFAMLNPSKGDAAINDQTIRRCIAFAKAAGCGALVIVNLFALRATKPKQLRGEVPPVGPHNEAVLAAAFALAAAAAPAGPVIVAWGAQPKKLLQGRDVAVMKMLTRAGLRPSCLGTTAKGCPRHPSRLGNDARLVPYQPPGLYGKGLN